MKDTLKLPSLSYPYHPSGDAISTKHFKYPIRPYAIPHTPVVETVAVPPTGKVSMRSG